MSTTATPEAPAAPETALPAEDAPVILAPTPEPTPVTPEALRALSPSERDKLLFDQQPVAPVAEEKKEEAKPVEPTEVVTPTQEPPAEEEETEAEKLPKNFRLHTEDPKQSAFLKAFKAAMNVNPQVNPADVARLVGYEMPGAPQVQAAVTEQIPAPDPITVMQQEADALEAQIDEIAAGEPLVTPEIVKLQRDHAKKLSDIAVAKVRAEHIRERSAEKAHTERVSARTAIKDAVLQEMPTANDGNSLLGAKIQGLYDAIQADPNHPDRARLAKDDGPRWIAEAARDAAVLELLGSEPNMTMAQARAKVVGTTEATRPAVTPAKTSTAIPRNAPVAAAKPSGAPEPAPLDLEKVRNDPKLRDAALGFNGQLIIR